MRRGRGVDLYVRKRVELGQRPGTHQLRTVSLGALEIAQHPVLCENSAEETLVTAEG